MRIRDKWHEVSGFATPGAKPEDIEAMRRVFYAGVASAWMLMIEETRQLNPQQVMHVLDGIRYELDEFQKEILIGIKPEGSVQ